MGNAAQSLELGNSGLMQVVVEDSIVGEFAAVDSRTAVGFVVDLNSGSTVAVGLRSTVWVVVGSRSVVEFAVGFD